VDFQVGDKVAYVDETGGGIVTKILENELVEIISDDGFFLTVSAKKLIVENPEIQESLRKAEYPASGSEGKAEEPSPRFVKRESKRDAESYEINLHAEDLIMDFTGLTNSDIIVKQLNYFREQMENAFKLKKRKLIVIHGVGKGILKQEVRYLLDGYEGVSYHDAPFSKYGYGATEVVIG
jgi:dsDNA-specific endonuclease/ATPase MutS2